MSAAGSDVYRATHSGKAAGVSRWASVPSALLCAVFLAFCVSLVPVSIDLHFLSGLDSSPARDVAVRVNVHKCEAHANPAVGAAAEAFLTNLASVCGLTESQLVVTASGIITSATGMEVGNRAGMNMSADLEENLGNLIAAADYPEWSTLSDEEKEGWGSAEVYNNVKFNELMDAFGLRDARERYYENWDGTGGGNFEFTQGEISNLQRIGRIGQNWISRLGNAFSEVKATVTDEQAFLTWYGAPKTAVVDATGYEGWPENAPTNFTINRTNLIRFGIDIGGGQYTSGGRAYSKEVYCVIWKKQDAAAGKDVYIGWGFDVDPYKLWQNANTIPTPDYDARSYLYEGETYYVDSSNMFSFGNNNESAIVYDVTVSDYATQAEVSAFRQAIPLILFGIRPSFDLVPDVEGYPEETPSSETPIYYPPDGDTSKWVNFITPPPSPRIENPYNPGNQTGTDEWRDETSKNVIPLEGIRFDKLFPFSLAFDLPKLHEKITENIAEESGGYEIVVIPIKTPLSEDAEDLELDLHPLAELLEMTAPFVLILLAVGLLWTLIMFWKGILTGD